jgi:CBS domain-containing protein
MKAKDVMTSNPITCQQTDFIRKAVEVMEQEDTGIVPIVNEENSCIGVITDRDICLEVVLREIDASSTPISKIIHHKLLSCSENDDLKDVIARMKEQQVKRIIVLDGEQCIGIISEHDFVKYMDKKIVGELAEAVYS